MTCLKLPLSSPTRFSTGTLTSSKNTSQKCRFEVTSTMGRIVMPGECMSTIRSDSPWCAGSVGSVRHTR